MLPVDIALGLAIRLGYVPADRKDECRKLVKGCDDYDDFTRSLRHVGYLTDQAAAVLWKKLELFERARGVIASLEKRGRAVPGTVLKKYIERLARENLEIEVILEEESIDLPMEEAAAEPPAAQQNDGLILYEEPILDPYAGKDGKLSLSLSGFPELELPDPPADESGEAAPPAEAEAPAEAPAPAPESPPAAGQSSVDQDLDRILGGEEPAAQPAQASDAFSSVENELDRALAESLPAEAEAPAQASAEEAAPAEETPAEEAPAPEEAPAQEAAPEVQAPEDTGVFEVPGTAEVAAPPPEPVSDEFRSLESEIDRALQDVVPPEPEPPPEAEPLPSEELSLEEEIRLALGGEAAPPPKKKPPESGEPPKKSK